MHNPLSKKIVRRGAVVFTSAAFLATLAAVPAMAISTPGNGPVSGTVSVQPGVQTIALSLDKTSFSTTTTQGQTTQTPSNGQGNGPALVNATITTNGFDTSGYTLSEALASPVTGFAGQGAISADTYSGADIVPLTDNPASGMQDGAGSVFGVTGASQPIVTTGGPSAAGGSPYELAWQFNTSTTQTPGSYAGSVTVTALTNS